MCIIKKFYFSNRLNYYSKQYTKYKNLLHVTQSFFISLSNSDYYCFLKNKNRYIKQLKKYEKKASSICDKLNIPLPDSFQ